MATRTAVRITARVVLVGLLLSAAAVPAVATLGGAPVAAAEHGSHAVGSSDRHAGDDLPVLPSHPADDTTHVVGVGTVDRMEVGERLEHAVQSGAESLCASAGVVSSLGFVLGYSRYDDSDPLDNDRRAAVYDIILASPGIYVSKVSDETVSHRSTVRYHVRVLEAEGLIAEEVERGKHRLYPADATDRSLIAALDGDATAAVLRALARLEPVSVSGIADDLDRAPSTVSHHLSRLADDGLVVRERDGNAVHTRLSPRVREVLEPAEAAVESGTDPANARAD